MSTPTKEYPAEYRAAFLAITLGELTALRQTEQATWLAFREAEETMRRCNTAWHEACTLKRQAFDAAMLAHGLTFDALLDLLDKPEEE